MLFWQEEFLGKGKGRDTNYTNEHEFLPRKPNVGLAVRNTGKGAIFYLTAESAENTKRGKPKKKN